MSANEISLSKNKARNYTKNKNEKSQSNNDSPHYNNSIPIVAIGASAGGFEALQSFFSNLPNNCELAFVVITHLEPNKKSLLSELLQKQTQITVTQIENNMEVFRNHIYVIPPNNQLEIKDRKFILTKKDESYSLFHPIDLFFRSVAAQCGDKAIAIVLSGSGSDGTMGIRDIKGEGGMVMAQDEKSAKFVSMPHNAIATGLVDYILPPEKMPAQLLEYCRLYNQRQKEILHDDSIPHSLKNIFKVLRSRTEHDFSQYKKNTVHRRIARRMYVNNIDDIPGYLDFINENSKEVPKLFKEMLIGVTRFFRDSEAFENLKTNQLTQLIVNAPAESSFRAWVAGCSTGEEAYSLAIIVQEIMDTLDKHLEIQIFATDIDENSISFARNASYPLSISEDVSVGRLKRFFINENKHYRVKTSIREMIVFATQSITRDPPVTKLHLLSCRNLLIYFEPELQKKVLPLFHYSLISGGILMLGSSESIGRSIDMFKVEDKTWKIFSSKPAPEVSKPILEFPTGKGDFAKSVPNINSSESKKQQSTTVQKIIETILQHTNLPPCVIINRNLEIIYVYGRTGKYLEQPSGIPSNNILDMARPGIKAKLNLAIQKVLAGEPDNLQQCPYKNDNNETIPLEIKVRSISNNATLRDMVMITFEIPNSNSKLPVDTAKSHMTHSDINNQVDHLEKELANTRENLQSTIEELEASNEELKSTNEELQSTNEELQSSNEELETSKEELQSLNEESTTVNAELQSRIDELSNANDDIKNFLDSTQIATVFLDIKLAVRRFTTAATKIIPLDTMDIGRSIEHFSTSLIDIELIPYAEKVLNDLHMQEIEANSKTGEIFRIRFRPYRTIKNVIDGVVIVFEEITSERNYSHKLVSDMRLITKTIVDTARTPFLLLDNNFTVLHVNKYFCQTFNLEEYDIVGTLVFSLMNGTWEIPQLRNILIDASTSALGIDGLTINNKSNHTDNNQYLMNACTILSRDERFKLILISIEIKVEI